MACQVTFLVFFIVFGAFFSVYGQNVVELDENNWSQMLKGEWMVEFYAPWCPACKALEPKWKDFARSGPALGIKVGAVDVTTSPGLSGRFIVTALPTIFHVLEGQFRQYKGSRDPDSFSLFIEDRKWESVEPVSRWTAPDSLQMSTIAWFFKFSHTLREIHNKFTSEYGLSPVSSYLIFAVATIIMGAGLGLILVCAIDFIFPQKTAYSRRKSGDKDDKDSGDELNDEDIKDDLVDQEEPEANSEAEQASTESEGSQKAEDSEKTGKARKRKTKRLDM